MKQQCVLRLHCGLFIRTREVVQQIPWLIILISHRCYLRPAGLLTVWRIRPVRGRRRSRVASHAVRTSGDLYMHVFHSECSLTHSSKSTPLQCIYLHAHLVPTGPGVTRCMHAWSMLILMRSFRRTTWRVLPIEKWLVSNRKELICKYPTVDINSMLLIF
jgi:hypothetical protein